jgi:N-acetylneuraminic acid mutarotase
MGTPREGHTANLLLDGTVFVFGGSDKSGSISVDLSASAELYDPDRGSWIMIGSMAAGRAGHTATLLRDGEVLVAAGSGGGIPGITLESAELYHPGGLE